MLCLAKAGEARWGHAPGEGQSSGKRANAESRNGLSEGIGGFMKHHPKRLSKSSIQFTTRQKVGVLLMAAGLVMAAAWVITDHPSLERLIAILFDLARIFLLI